MAISIFLAASGTLFLENEKGFPENLMSKVIGSILSSKDFGKNLAKTENVKNCNQQAHDSGSKFEKSEKNTENEKKAVAGSIASISI